MKQMQSIENRLKKLEKRSHTNTYKVVVIVPGLPEPTEKEIEEATVVFRVKFE